MYEVEAGFMLKLICRIIVFGVIMGGCSVRQADYTKEDIVKVTDFELSPSEEKIAFSAITSTGNLDIWIIDIEGKNLRKLTFQDRSPTNHIAKFFKKHHWRNFFEIDMSSPKWTEGGRIEFCQQLSKNDNWGDRAVSRRYWTIDPSGMNKKPQADSDRVIKKHKTASHNKFKFSVRSEKYKLKVFFKNNGLWILKDGSAAPQKLIQ
jgi:hypothetical protein